MLASDLVQAPEAARELSRDGNLGTELTVDSPSGGVTVTLDKFVVPKFGAPDAAPLTAIGAPPIAAIASATPPSTACAASAPVAGATPPAATPPGAALPPAAPPPPLLRIDSSADHVAPGASRLGLSRPSCRPRHVLFSQVGLE